jgi:hypothetical protein
MTPSSHYVRCHGFTIHYTAWGDAALPVVIAWHGLARTGRDFDALALVEDELIMALPFVPRHEICPEAVVMAVSDPEVDAAQERPHPFAALAGLKKPTSS